MALAEPLPLPAPEPGPFAGWVGVIVPADEPGEQTLGVGHHHHSASATPGKILLLVPPGLLEALRSGS